MNRRRKALFTSDRFVGFAVAAVWFGGMRCIARVAA